MNTEFDLKSKTYGVTKFQITKHICSNDDNLAFKCFKITFLEYDCKP